MQRSAQHLPRGSVRAGRDGLRAVVMARARRRRLLRIGSAVGALVAAFGTAAAERPAVDTALVLAVDVSNSIDTGRYSLQLGGIAAALEDPGVQDVLTAGQHGAVALAVVIWSDKPRIVMPWTRIASAGGARDFARRLRALPRQSGEFTCLARMLELVRDKMLPQLPFATHRRVIDVSGDGKDNCNSEPGTAQMRDRLASERVTINGLPILAEDQAGTLEAWYRGNVIGGPGAFLLTAAGHEDFPRAFRKKFVLEISGIAPALPFDRLSGLTLRPPAAPGAGRNVLVRASIP